MTPPNGGRQCEAEVRLAKALAALAPRGILLGCRTIADEDEASLLPEEARSIRARQPAARRASGAARLAARRLLAELGRPNFPILRGDGGAPLWPPGCVGSLAHDDDVAVAAVASAADILSLGVDVEPAEPLPEDVAAVAATGGDVLRGADPRLAGRLLFAAKEAAYKAVFPLDRKVLGHEHIAVDLGTRLARTPGREVRLAFCIAPRIVVLALVGRR